MDVKDDKETERILLKKLYTLGCWGTRHTSESNLNWNFKKEIEEKLKTG